MIGLWLGFHFHQKRLEGMLPTIRLDPAQEQKENTEDIASWLAGVGRLVFLRDVLLRTSFSRYCDNVCSPGPTQSAKIVLFPNRNAAVH